MAVGAGVLRVAVRITVLAACVLAALGSPVVADLPPPRPARISVPADDWLGAVNHYRRQSGLEPVSADGSRSEGIRLHLVYLANTPADLRTGPYANDHTENPASPWYTEAGAAAARSSNLGRGANDRLAIEAWMAAPFHAIGIIRPALRTSSFARMPSGFAGLDVSTGLVATATSRPPAVVFPGSGSLNHLSSRRSELPDPTEQCGPGFDGLPLIAMLSDPPPSGTTATVRTPAGSTWAEGDDLCVVTAARFATTDSTYGATGVAILRDANAVLVIPRLPLTAGVHEVTVSGGGRQLAAWSFTQAHAFDDIGGYEHFATPVRWLSANRITGGVTTRSFGPALDVTRGQMAALLHEFAGAPTPAAPLRYEDVSADAHYATGVRWLDEEAITSGTTPTTFDPQASVTRAQMAAFLHRLAGSPAPTAPLRFSDVPPAAYYATAVRWLDEHRVTGGVTSSAFHPAAAVTRGQVATFLYRLDAVLPR